MKYYFLLLLATITSIFNSCKNQQDNAENKLNAKDKIEVLSKEKEREELYKRIKQKNLRELIGSERETAIDEWVSLLKSEPAFIDAEKSLVDYTSAIVNRDEDVSPSQEVSNNKDDRVKHLKSQGIRNPEKANFSQLNLIKNYLLIIQKYPEIRRIDKSTLKIILSRAAGETDYTEIKK